jgi:hypothetical protein
MSKQESPKFFVDADPTFCRIPHPNRCTGKSLPEILEHHEFTDLGWDEHTRIYLPATEKMPESSYICEEVPSPRNKHRQRLSVEGVRKVRYDGVMRKRPFSEPITDFVREMFLEQARARVGKKKLPRMDIFSATWHGTAKMPFTVICESVRGPKALTGSYVVIEPWSGKSKHVVECLRLIIGNRQAYQLVNPLEEMLENEFPEFPWFSDHTRSFMSDWKRLVV